MEPSLPQVFVINLERSAERREFVKRQLAHWPGDWSFHTATDGSTLSKSQRRQVSQLRAFWKYGRFLHPNEIGCALSHRSVWQQIVDQKISEALILEDDIRVTSKLHEILAARNSWLPPGWGIVNFSHDIAKPIPLSLISDEFNVQLCRFEGVVGRAGAYLLNRDAASNMLAAAPTVFRVSDDHTGDEKILKMGLYGTLPRLANWDDGIPSDTWVETTYAEHALTSRTRVAGMALRALRRVFR